MKKLFVLIFVVAMGGFLLTSCGGNGKKQNNRSSMMSGKQMNGTMMNREKKQNNTSTTAVNTTVSKNYTANLENGKKVYTKVCIACHMTGVAGAPALKDKTRWVEIAAKGMKQLHHDAINGFTGKTGVMPAKGGCSDCSGQDIYDAVAYMLKTAGVKAK